MDKFIMELVWHNCKTCPPKELCNDELIGTNGHYVFDLSWFRNEGYFISVHSDDDYKIEDYALENWWWADIQQTVQGETRFKR